MKVHPQTAPWMDWEHDYKSAYIVHGSITTLPMTDAEKRKAAKDAKAPKRPFGLASVRQGATR